ncbi:MAG TPA: hypothetical protein VHA82_23825 [Ramlibacter sp.]|uniref:hypothetical protein n=1 Tax=Ramlibacter sp. TaxID=1917967 RepID=UPI002C747249|nr:hypothetical protein [Ramlibacter sp.]HVZ46857.1 hypothetical protein [Ramlibacter sp.]
MHPATSGRPDFANLPDALVERVADFLGTPAVGALSLACRRHAKATLPRRIRLLDADYTRVFNQYMRLKTEHCALRSGTAKIDPTVDRMGRMRAVGGQVAAITPALDRRLECWDLLVERSSSERLPPPRLTSPDGYLASADAIARTPA